LAIFVIKKKNCYVGRVFIEQLAIGPGERILNVFVLEIRGNSAQFLVSQYLTVQIFILFYENKKIARQAQLKKVIQ
jgi:hypothetical protein